MIPSNPFCTRFVRPGMIPYRFADARDGDLERLASDIAATQVGLIVGPHGTGKSTLLATLRPVLATFFPAIADVMLMAPAMDSAPTWWQRRRIRAANWRAVSDAMISLADRGLLILDGAEQLSPGHWRRLYERVRQRNQTLLATSHAELSGAGVLYRTGNPPGLVRALTRALVTNDLVTDDPALWTRVERELSLRQVGPGTNVRDLWFDLYDLAQPRRG